MNDLLRRTYALLTTDRVVDAGRAVAILALTMVSAPLIGLWLRRSIAQLGDTQRADWVAKLARWSILALGFAAALEELGFKLNVVLGAAGIFTVAIGFASQTTLANLISGFFLFGERPFRVGDTLEVDGIIGEVLSIDMMSTTLRTADNRFVRIPNELVLKTKIINHSRFPLRRLDVTIAIGHHEDFERVRAVLLEIADRNELCLEEPAPSVFISSFGETSAQVQLWFWVRTENLQKLREEVTAEVQETLAGTKRSTALPAS